MSGPTGLFETVTGRLAVFHRGQQLSWVDCRVAEDPDAMALFWRGFFEHHKPTPQMALDLVSAPPIAEIRPGFYARNLLAT